MSKLISWGFIAAGLSNILGILVVSRGFTNTALNAADPGVMSNFGLVMIMVWGLAYIAVAKSYHHVPALVGVFAIEKLAYAVNWALWMRENGDTLVALSAQDATAGRFYMTYGISDFVFMLFFAWVAIRTWRQSRQGQPAL